MELDAFYINSQSHLLKSIDRWQDKAAATVLKELPFHGCDASEQPTVVMVDKMSAELHPFRIRAI